MTVNKSLSTASLENLQSSDARKIMDTVDTLRKTDLGSILQLPQICVSGDQSSGKSSVLEALTGIPFPRKENLCTRYATEIVLRRAKTESVSVAIIPDKLRSQEEQIKLKDVSIALTDFARLGDLMDEVTKMLGLGKPGQAKSRAFSRDVLSIEISGPSRPHLTLVDLPGLIHSGNKQQTKEDVDTVKALVEDYIKEQRTIVLAVVSAKNDYANQIILEKARELGAAGRTLGVITKPDYLEAGSENEKAWLVLAQNKDVHFGLGWHMLKNRSEKEMDLSPVHRDQNETTFFARGAYRELDRAILGVNALRERLSNLLFEHLTRELPHLQMELNEKHKDTTSTLDRLGQSRKNALEQRSFLMNIGQEFQNVAQAAIDGQYEAAFFGNADASRPLTHAANISRLRAVIQHANLQFASQMRQYGSKYSVTEMPTELKDDGKTEGTLDREYTFARDNQIPQTTDQAILWALNIIQRSRGRELPGNFNPMIVSQLFKEQSEQWDSLASAHLLRVAGYCATFVKSLLKSSTTEDVYEKIMLHMVEPSLERRKRQAQAQLHEILQDKDGHPITYNHYYTTTLQKMRAQRSAKGIENLLRKHSIYNGVRITDLDGLIDSIRTASVEEDMDRCGAEDALVSQMAFYKDALKYFIDCVSIQVIERCLIKNLAKDIISAVAFGNMTDEQVRALAAEPVSIIQEREGLEKRKAILEAGQEAFSAALGAF